MDLFTHFLVGMVIYTSVFGQITTDLLYLAAIFAIMPDFDTFITRPLQRWFKSKYLEHRGGSHSYVVGIIVSFLVNLVYAPVSGNNFWLGWLIGSLFYGLHVSMDLLTTTKIPFLFPLSKIEPSFYAEKAGSLFTMILSVVFLAILIPLRRAGSEESFRSVSSGATIFFAVYYLYRILLKYIVSRNFNENQMYLPGILPIYYLIYESEISEKLNLVHVNLIKKSIFGRSWDVFSFDANLTPAEFLLYQQALSLCNRDYYRNKWTKIPVISRENSHLSVRFYFLETAMNGRTMSLSYVYDYEGGKFEETAQNYGRIKAN
jgi:membrane-bound metal-dependent hydrolase YbcI (DUF457 family)